MGLTADPAPVGLPQAAEAPERLRQFLFYMARDLVPMGYIEHALARAHSVGERPPYAAHPELDALATRWAKELSAPNLR